MNALIVGGGKFALGCLVPLMTGRITDGATLTLAVRKSQFWQNVRETGGTSILTVIAHNGHVNFMGRFVLNETGEPFSAFIDRVQSQTATGVWLYDNQKMLAEAIVDSNVVGTCVGAGNFEKVLSEILDAYPKVGRVYAFENQPVVIADVARRYQKRVDVRHCVIDRVVVSREYAPETRVITVRLGLDQSHLLMINDPNGDWKNILQVTDDTGPLVITGDLGLLNRKVKCKQHCKNNVHKLAGTLAVLGKPIMEVKDKSLVELGKLSDVVELLEIKDSIIMATIVMCCGEEIAKDPDAAVFTYAEFSAYYDNSTRTVYADGSDTVGRLLHMSSYEEFKCDRTSLRKSLEELREASNDSRCFCQVADALGGIVNVTEEKVKEHLDKLIQILSE